jgi:hypothetical protein
LAQKGVPDFIDEEGGRAVLMPRPPAHGLHLGGDRHAPSAVERAPSRPKPIGQRQIRPPGGVCPSHAPAIPGGNGIGPCWPRVVGGVRLRRCADAPMRRVRVGPGGSGSGSGSGPRLQRRKTVEIRHGSRWSGLVQVFPSLFHTPRMRMSRVMRATRFVMCLSAATKKRATDPDHPDPPGPFLEFRGFRDGRRPGPRPGPTAADPDPAARAKLTGPSPQRAGGGSGVRAARSRRARPCAHGTA